MNNLRHILIVDEHPAVLEQMVSRLGKEDDLVVSSVAGAKHCLQALDGIDADVLLIDPQLNQELNVSLIRAVRERYSGIRIIALMAVVDTRTRLLLHQLGVEQVLEKGLTTEKLLETIRGK